MRSHRGGAPEALQALARALKAVAPMLSEAQASQGLEAVLKRIDQTTDPDALHALDALAQALQALPVRLTEAQASQALEPLLKQIGRTTDPYRLQAQAQALQALAPMLSEAQASRGLEAVLKRIDQTTDPEALSALAQALQALRIKLIEAQVVQASNAAASSLGWAASDGEAAEWARALVTLSRSSPNRDSALVKAIAYPAAAGSATEVLLDEIRAAHPDAPTKEAGTEAALKWLADTYPSVRGSPVCPQPLQPGLECPPSASQ
jgi:hypothetical protein